ncbi:MAG TPA: SCP2 sterol-binding domain-containing protein, partial [Candidatus Izemoplasmatales bacterium]|nr:SCP2 sterol-binding domain-containing protein [Candidatus Izemoplasmatales bacterium]
DPEIIQEFLFNCQLDGLDAKNVNSYHFFSEYFLGLKEGFYYLPVSVDDIRQLLIEKLKIINPKIIQSRRIKEYVGDQNNIITHVVDSTNKEIHAKHIIVGAKPDAFYEKYFSDLTEHAALIKKYYPDLQSPIKVRTIYLALNQKPQTLGINEMDYYFHISDRSRPVVTRLFNYSKYDQAASGPKRGALCIDYVYNENSEVGEHDLLSQVYERFPKLKKAVVGIKQGVAREHLSMVSLDEVRKGLSINEEIAIEASEHLMFFDNLHLTGSWVRPEAGLFGRFHTGIVLGDKVEESLYYGENDDSFYYLTNDEIMVMLKHNYGRKTLGKLENHINFQIGKSSYFIRIKDKNLTVHRGEYPHPDLTIYSTNDKLSNLLLKKVCFDAVLKSGGLKYTGSSELLYKVVDAFELDDFKETEKKSHPELPIKNSGAKLMFLYLLTFSVIAFLHNFFDLIWLAPFGLGISVGLGYVKWRFFRKISWFEYAWGGIYLGLTLAAIFWPWFNTWHSDDLLLGIMGSMFFISWLANRPVVHDFRKYDYRADYAETRFFKTVNNGITFVWALIFLVILGGVYVSGERYVSAWYNLVFLGIFLTYYYPIIYVSTNIKK